MHKLICFLTQYFQKKKQIQESSAINGLVYFCFLNSKSGISVLQKQSTMNNTTGNYIFVLMQQTECINIFYDFLQSVAKFEVTPTPGFLSYPPPPSNKKYINYNTIYLRSALKLHTIHFFRLAPNRLSKRAIIHINIFHQQHHIMCHLNF